MSNVKSTIDLAGKEILPNNSPEIEGYNVYDYFPVSDWATAEWSELRRDYRGADVDGVGCAIVASEFGDRNVIWFRG